LELEQIRDVLITRLQGELDLNTSDQLREILDDTINIKPVKNMVINLAEATFIDSSVLGVMLGRYKRIVKLGGKVILVAPQPQVRRILELSGLLGIMEEYSNEEEALKRIG
jgi:stage II sporulation protein AA (anti-sigma F factor antagonist)